MRAYPVTQEKKILSGFAQALMQKNSSKKRGNETTPPAPATSTSKANTASTKPSNASSTEQKSTYRLGDAQKSMEKKIIQEDQKREKEVENLKTTVKEKDALLKARTASLEQKQELLKEKDARIALLEAQAAKARVTLTTGPVLSSVDATAEKEEHTIDHVDNKKPSKDNNNFERPRHYSVNKIEVEPTRRSASANEDTGRQRSTERDRDRNYRSRSRDHRERSPTYRSSYRDHSDYDSDRKTERQPSRSYTEREDSERRGREPSSNSTYTRREHEGAKSDRRTQEHKPRLLQEKKKEDIISTPAPPTTSDAMFSDDVQRLIAMMVQKELKEKCEKEGTPMPTVTPRLPRCNRSPNKSQATPNAYYEDSSTGNKPMNVQELSSSKSLLEEPQAQALTRLVSLMDTKYASEGGREKVDAPPTGFIGSGQDSEPVNTKNAMVYIRELTDYMTRSKKKLMALRTIESGEANKILAQSLLSSLEEQRVALAKKNPTRGNTRLQIQCQLIDVRNMTGQKSITSCSPEEIVQILTEEYITDSTLDNAITALQTTVQEHNELMAVYFSRFCSKVAEVRDCAGDSQYANDSACVKLFFRGMLHNYHRNQLQAQGITTLKELHEALKIFMKNEQPVSDAPPTRQVTSMPTTRTGNSTRPMQQRLSATTHIQQSTPQEQIRSGGQRVTISSAEQEKSASEAARKKSFSVYCYRWLVQTKTGECTRCQARGHRALECPFQKQMSTLTTQDLQNGYDESLHETYISDYYKLKDNSEGPPQDYKPGLSTSGKRQHQEDKGAGEIHQHKSPRNESSTIPSRLDTETNPRIRTTASGGYVTTKNL